MAAAVVPRIAGFSHSRRSEAANPPTGVRDADAESMMRRAPTFGLDDLSQASSVPIMRKHMASLPDDMRNSLDETLSQSSMMTSASRSHQHEAIKIQVTSTSDGQIWQADTKRCGVCHDKLGAVLNKRHHCRVCGKCVCSNCTPHRLQLHTNSWTLERVCTPCVKSGAGALNMVSRLQQLSDELHHLTAQTASCQASTHPLEAVEQCFKAMEPLRDLRKNYVAATALTAQLEGQLKDVMERYSQAQADAKSMHLRCANLLNEVKEERGMREEASRRLRTDEARAHAAEARAEAAERDRVKAEERAETAEKDLQAEKLKGKKEERRTVRLADFATSPRRSRTSELDTMSTDVPSGLDNSGEMSDYVMNITEVHAEDIDSASVLSGGGAPIPHEAESMSNVSGYSPLSRVRRVSAASFTSQCSMSSIISASSTWEEDTLSCNICEKKIGKRHFRRRHHCRLCGKCVCSACSPNLVVLPDVQNRQRACNRCVEVR